MNPYYLAWLRAGGFCKPLYMFSLWIKQKHREFRAMHEINDVNWSNKYQGYVTSWYEDKFSQYILWGPHERIE